MANPLWKASAGEMARLIRNKEASSAEIVESCIWRVEAVNPKINAVVHWRPDDALEQAKALDKRAAKGDWAGPLHGVPITIKDSMATAGLKTTAGTLGWKDHVPDEDATVVARLKQAGAALLGKTNLPELCIAFESDNLVHGKTSNPYDLSKTAGGSSGGESGIIAAGGSPLGLGSDAGGSIREPCHFSGIAGIKPTSGRIPRTGHMPPHGGVYDSLWQIGPMARTVEDLALAMPILSGPDDCDAMIYPVALRDPNVVDCAKLRVAFYTRNNSVDASSETVAAVGDVAKRLGGLGVRVEEATPLLLQDSHVDWLRIFGPDGGEGLSAAIAALGSAECHPLMRQALDKFSQVKMTTAEFGAFLGKIDAYRSAMLGFMKNYDAILCPACAQTAVPHGSTWADEVYPSFSYTIDYNFTGYPAAVVRAGTGKGGLPIGVQIVAKPWREDIALALARVVEDEFGGWIEPGL